MSNVKIQLESALLSNLVADAVADPDFELTWGPGFGLLALRAFLPSVISSFFTQNKAGGGGGGSWAPPLVPPLR